MSNKVYVLYDGTYDEREVLGVFSTKEKAKAYMEKTLKKVSCVRCEGTGKVEPSIWNSEEGICRVCDGVGHTYGCYANIEDELLDPEE